MSAQDRGPGPGGAPEATGVEPSAVETESADETAGAIAIPLGSPVGANELRELKRHAERPDLSAEQDPSDQDPEASGP